MKNMKNHGHGSLREIPAVSSSTVQLLQSQFLFHAVPAPGVSELGMLPCVRVLIPTNEISPV